MDLQKGDATDFCGNSSKRNEVIEVGNFSLWSELPDVLLAPILKRVGVIDYFMFACVCKSWRSVAIAFKHEFMASQAPLVFLRLAFDRECCYFYNIFDKRLYSIALPHLSRSECLGFSCGYLVLRKWSRRTIWLVNPFTRHELEYPEPPASYSNVILASLVNSDSYFVAVAFSRLIPFELQFYRSGDVNWTYLEYRALDVAVFEGKIYVLSEHGQIGTLNLNPPSVTSLHVKRELSMSSYRHLVVSNEKLYVAEFRPAQGFTEFYKLDFERMDWEKVKLKDEVLFLGDMKCCGLSFVPPSWEHSDKQLNRVVYLGRRSILEDYVAGGSSMDVPVTPDDWKPETFLRSPVWYFPHLSTNVDSVYED